MLLARRNLFHDRTRCLLSVVIVSHDQRIRDIADRVLWLEDGAFRDIVTMATGLRDGGRTRTRCHRRARWRDVLLLLAWLPGGVPRRPAA